MYYEKTRESNVHKSFFKYVTILLVLLTAILSACSSGKPDSELKVYCFQAGKADAFLLYNDDGAVLIDCGSKGFGEPILAYLEQQNIKKLDCLIITHFDQDHVGGAASVVKNIAIDRILQNDNEKDSKECEKYAKALDKTGTTPEVVDDQASIKFKVGDADYTVYSGASEYKKDDSNNASLITSVKYGSKRLLFTGDIQSKRIDDFVGKNRYTYDFLKVPHHGLSEKKTDNLIDSVKPKFAVITSSDLEMEDEETISLLKEAGADVFLTREGPVLVTTDGETMKAEHVE